jgi:Ser/Thr protein kinase RdoA (MazF antagonist)
VDAYAPDFAGRIARALARYGITDYTARFIRHNENAVFDVTDLTASRRYLLRIHEPVAPNLLGIQHTFEGLCSEAEILRAFRAGTGLQLQQPVPNDAGLYVTSVSDPATGCATPCTLLTWIDGEVLGGKDPRVDGLVPEIAGTIARMHSFARAWRPDRPLMRPVYDALAFIYQVDRAEVGVEFGLFSRGDYSVFQETMRAIAALFDRTPHTPNRWGIIHADLQPGNFVLARGRPVPIDFGFSGYGYYLFDVGVLSAALSPGQRRLLLDAYGQVAGPLGPDDRRLVDASFLLGIFGAVGHLISDPKRHDWIKRRMPWWAGEYCRRFLAGESPVAADE